MHCFDTHVSGIRSELSYNNDRGRDLASDILCMMAAFIYCDVEYPSSFRHAEVARNHLIHGSRKALKRRLHKAERRAARREIQLVLEEIATDARREDIEERERQENLYWDREAELEREDERRWDRECKAMRAEAHKGREIEAAYQEDTTGEAVDAHAMEYDEDYDEYVYSLTSEVAYC